MVFFISSLAFCLITLLFFIFTAFMYFKLVIAVRNNKDVPEWMYKIGHAIKGRGGDSYENITNSAALREVNIYLSSLVLLNIAFIIVLHYRGQSIPEAVYLCLKAEFILVVILRILGTASKIILFIFGIIKKSSNSSHEYASSNAVIGMVFMTAFIFMFTIFLFGLPAKPIEVKIAKSRIIVGSTKASELLSEGFDFYGKKSGTVIINKRDSHFYYGEPAELIRNGKSYGIVYLTPEWEDSAKLKDCVITYYGISAKNGQMSAVKINSKNISELNLNDFKNKKMTDIFSLTPADYKENNGNHYFNLQLQTNNYMLWKRYTVEVHFDENGTASMCEVRTQHTIWE